MKAFGSMTGFSGTPEETAWCGGSRGSVHLEVNGLAVSGLGLGFRVLG